MSDLVERLRTPHSSLVTQSFIMHEAADRIAELEVQLRAMTEHYVELAGCGDCGFWDPEAEPEVIAARATLNPSARSE